jgi:hypothetical protein
MLAQAAITNANMEPLLNCFEALLEMSNGLPPPLSPSDTGLDFVVVAELV